MVAKPIRNTLESSGLPPQLSRVLLRLAKGESTKEIARNIRKPNGDPLSPGTISSYREALLYKLNARNTPELIAKAFETGALKYLSLLISLLLPLQGYLPTDSDLGSIIRNTRSRPSRARRSRRGGKLFLDSLALDQILDPSFCLAGDLVANWDPESNDFYFSISPRSSIV